MKYCPQCGTENADENRFCISCGTQFNEPQQVQSPVGSLPPGPMVVGQEQVPPAEQPSEQTLQDAFFGTAEPIPEPVQEPGAPPSNPIMPPPMQVMPPPITNQYGGPIMAPGQQSQLAVWSLVLGIISVVCCCVGIIAGPVAIVLATQARKDPYANQGMATAGFILGIIGTVLGLIELLNSHGHTWSSYHRF